MGWRPEAIPLYWRAFVRYMVDDTLTLPFIYDRLDRGTLFLTYKDLQKQSHLSKMHRLPRIPGSEEHLFGRD